MIFSKHYNLILKKNSYMIINAIIANLNKLSLKIFVSKNNQKYYYYNCKELYLIWMNYKTKKLIQNFHFLNNYKYQNIYKMKKIMNLI